jgi:outer membrane protein assembly factor BamB
MVGNDIDLGNVPVLNPAVISREGLSEGVVLVNCDTGTALSLNSTGTLVWDLIDGKRGPLEITAAVLGHFQDPPDTVGEDVRSLIAVLAEEGFIGYEMKTTKTRKGR